MRKDIFCCGQKVKKSRNPKTNTYTVQCLSCGKTATANSADEAENQFEQTPTKAVAIPDRPERLPTYFAGHMAEMAHITVPFVARDKPALTRLVKNNVRYVMLKSKKNNYAQVWQTEEGQESIVHALEEALSLGAELGKMGSLVPFGKVVEFIPAIEAYEFALTNGGNPPFRWIQIDMVHKNDIADVSRINGEFNIKIKPGIPRGELKAVAVYGHNNRLGHTIGEVYDVDRLLEKAKRHSTSYKYYLEDKRAFQMARVEGKLQREGDREYFTKTMHKRGGGTWEKQIFEDEITNPYEGPDQPEMLRKAAGKSFLGKYARIRNSEAAMDEVSGSDESQVDEMIDRSIDAAFATMDAPPAEYAYTEPEPDEPTPEPQPKAEKPAPKKRQQPQESTLVDEMKQKVAANRGEEAEELDIF